MKKYLLVGSILLPVIGCTTHRGHHGNAGGDGMMSEGHHGQMKKMMESPDMHEKMARMHQEMASCLRSSKDKDSCMEKMKSHRAEMMQQHKSKMTDKAKAHKGHHQENKAQ